MVSSDYTPCSEAWERILDLIDQQLPPTATPDEQTEAGIRAGLEIAELIRRLRPSSIICPAKPV